MNQTKLCTVAVLLVALPIWSRNAISQDIRVDIDCKPELHATAKRIDFAGKTNLPEGTVLIVRAGPKIGPLDTRQHRLSLPSDQIPWGSGTVKAEVQKDGMFTGHLKTSGKVKSGAYLFKIDVPVYACFSAKAICSLVNLDFFMNICSKE